MKALDERAKKIADGLAAADKAKSDLAHAEKKSSKKCARRASPLRTSVLLLKSRPQYSSMKRAPKPPESLPRPVKPPRPKLASLPSVPKEALRDQVAHLAVAGAERSSAKEINAQAHADLLANLKQELQ